MLCRHRVRIAGIPGFDYVIVGAGSAGLRARQPAVRGPRRSRVLLLEAGGKDRTPEHQDPGGVRRTSSTPSSTGTTRPSPSRTSTAARCTSRAARALGGSSSMNAMLYVRGRPLDYDLLGGAGRAGLGLPTTCCRTSCARRTTRAAPRSSTAPAARCASPSSARRGRSTARLLAASEAAGIPRDRRLQRPRAGRRLDVPGHPAATAARWSAADAFLRPALDAPEPRGASPARTVLGVELEGDRAAGVRYAGAARRRAASRAPSARCSCRAGAIGSPQLLLLSGHRRRPTSCARPASTVAPRAARASARNLQDHPFVTMHLGGLRPRHAVRRRQAQAAGRVAAAPHRASSPRRSPRSSPSCARAAGLPAADIQFHMGAAYYEDHGAEEYDGHCDGDRAGARLARRRAARCGCARPTRPPSRGSSPTRCPSPTTSPRCVAGMRAGARDRARRRRCATIVVRELKPGAGVADATRTSRPTCAGG